MVAIQRGTDFPLLEAAVDQGAGLFAIGFLIDPVFQVLFGGRSISTTSRAFVVVDIFVGRMPTSERAGQFDGLALAIGKDPAGDITSLPEGQTVLAVRIGEIVIEVAVPGNQEQDV